MHHLLYIYFGFCRLSLSELILLMTLPVPASSSTSSSSLEKTVLRWKRWAGVKRKRKGLKRLVSSNLQKGHILLAANIRQVHCNHLYKITRTNVFNFYQREMGDLRTKINFFRQKAFFAIFRAGNTFQNVTISPWHICLPRPPFCYS